MNRTYSRVISIIGLVLFLCSCSATLFRGVEHEKPEYYADYLGEISLKRSAPREKSDYSQMEIARDYFVKWRDDIYMVPRGMRTDFASIPSRVRTLIAVLQVPDIPTTQDISLSDSLGIWTEPSIVHDAGYGDDLEIVFVHSASNSKGNKLILKNFGSCYKSRGMSNDQLDALFIESDSSVGYDDLLGENSEIVGEQARLLFLAELHPSSEASGNGIKASAVDKFLSSATVYSLSDKYRNALGEFNELDDCYCKRRSCIDDRSTIDSILGNFLYRSGMRELVVDFIMPFVGMGGKKHWADPKENPIKRIKR